jgi:translation initiation factor IF-2-like protein
MLSPDYSKRDYLLPEGCKDLIDVINLEQQKKALPVWLFKGNKFADKIAIEALLANYAKTKGRAATIGELPGVPPPITGDLEVAEPMTVGKLAELLGQKPSSIIADLLQLGVFATAKQAVSFGAISKVARKYGFAAKKRV